MISRLLSRVRGWFSRPKGEEPAVGAGSEPSATALDELRAEHDEVRDKAHREVGEVLTCTEEATMSVCSNLDRVVTEAQSFIGEIKSRLGDLEGDSEGSGVSETLDGQCQLVTSFLEELRATLQLQRSAAERMLATSEKVSKAASSVSQISTASRVLCLNTMIEAGRLGEVGQPMIVIADQMRSLSEEIAKSNEEISEHMAALLPTLEEVGASSAQVDERAAVFSSEFEEQAGQVGAIATQLRETAEAALGGGDDKMDSILGSSRSALESLQTQDLVSQRLRRVLQILDRTATSADVRDDFADARVMPEKPDVYLSDSMGGEEKRELDAGEMMMF